MNLELKVEIFANEDVIATSSVSHSDKLMHAYRGADSYVEISYCEVDKVFHYGSLSSTEIDDIPEVKSMTQGWYYWDSASKKYLPCTDDTHYRETKDCTPYQDCTDLDK